MSSLEYILTNLSSGFISNKNKINFIICVLFLIFAYIVMNQQIQVVGHGVNVTYEFADNITSEGLGDNSGDNVTLINYINEGYWQGNESTTDYQIYVWFYNVSKFNWIESFHKYNSTVGVTSHYIDREIYSPVYDDFVNIETFTNEDSWTQHSHFIVNSSRYIMPNGTVVLRYNHPSEGNTNHRIQIDKCRLIFYN